MNTQETHAVDVSIIIVNYNTRDLLRDCLKTVFNQRSKYSYEVLVVDNASKDDSALMVRDEFEQVHLFPSVKNLGFVKANNKAMLESRGRYLLLLNPDTQVPPDTLDKLVDFIEDQAGVGICGCKQVDAQGQIQLTWGKFPTVLSEIQRKARHMRMDLKEQGVRVALENNISDQCDVDWVAGSCMLVRAEVALQIGLMDENIFMYFEDIDWCQRARLAGWRVCIDPRNQIVHYGGESAATDKIVSLVEYRRSQLYFLRKYRGRFFYLMTRLWIFIKALGYFGLWALRYGWYTDPDAKHEAECMSLVYKHITYLALTGKMPAKIER